jgi:hypothetical protein
MLQPTIHVSDAHFLSQIELSFKPEIHLAHFDSNVAVFITAMLLKFLLCVLLGCMNRSKYNLHYSINRVRLTCCVEKIRRIHVHKLFLMILLLTLLIAAYKRDRKWGYYREYETCRVHNQSRKGIWTQE